MINLIRMDLYRMLHTASTWILIGVISLFAIISFYMGTVDQKLMEETGERNQLVIKGEDEEGMQFGITVNTPYHEDGSEAAYLEYVCADLQSGILLIFISIFAVVYVNAEEKSGFVKNIAGQFSNRFWMYLSKNVVVSLFVLMAMITYMIMQIFGVLIWHRGAPFGIDMAGEALRYGVIQWLLMSAFAAGIVLITTLIKSTAIGITIGMMISCGFSQIFLGFYYKIFQNTKLHVEEYLITNNIKTIVYNSSMNRFLQAILVGAVFLLVYNIIGSVVMQKRDVV
ncbi:MAG: hypothetical protein K1W19_09290 [Lachnospiraceae bacterium]